MTTVGAMTALYCLLCVRLVKFSTSLGITNRSTVCFIIFEGIFMNTEFFNDSISLTGSFNEQGQISVQNIVWQERSYTIVTVGRQWMDEAGRHVMAEGADSTRFELELSRDDLIWRVKKVWRSPMDVSFV